MSVESIETAEISLRGGRKNNQDRCAVLRDQDSTLLVVADGLGGHPKGEVAAQILVNVCKQIFSRIIKPIRAPEQLMKACLAHAHHAIIDYGRRHKPPISPRTTAVLAILQGNMAYWIHIGDSRLYLIRDHRIIAQTRDHSVAELPDSEQQSLAAGISRHAITRCLGGDPPPPSASISAPTPLQPGDYILLCTDGFWGPLEPETIIDGLSADSSLQLAISRLATTATQHDPVGSDNATAAVAHLPACKQASGEVSLEIGENESDTLDQTLNIAVGNLKDLIHKHDK